MMVYLYGRNSVTKANNTEIEKRTKKKYRERKRKRLQTENGIAMEVYGMSYPVVLVEALASF